MVPLSLETRSMFGCLAVYVQDKIVLILRDKREGTADNGVWLATTEEHHQSLRREFPNMRSIQVFGKKVTGWQVLPADAKGSRCSELTRAYSVFCSRTMLSRLRRSSGRIPSFTSSLVESNSRK
jgi:hypothetical protein